MQQGSAVAFRSLMRLGAAHSGALTRF